MLVNHLHHHLIIFLKVCLLVIIRGIFAIENFVDIIEPCFHIVELGIGCILLPFHHLLVDLIVGEGELPDKDLLSLHYLF